MYGILGKFQRKFLVLLFCLPLCLISSCWWEDEPKAPRGGPLEISIFTGMSGVARIGETFQSVTQSPRFAYKRIDLSGDADIQKLGFTDAIEFGSIGVKVYFRRSGVVLITAQEPFKGGIKNKKIKLFSFAVPVVSEWAELLTRELGPPEARASGGRFGSEGLFYIWGDISYNRMGPNQMALYRDPEIAKYRLSHFGREIQLFPEKK